MHDSRVQMEGLQACCSPGSSIFSAASADPWRTGHTLGCQSEATPQDTRPRPYCKTTPILVSPARCQIHPFSQPQPLWAPPM